ncbi:hypothetical protein IFM89_028439 [Coptis chinensis]|uniref:Uncharacterized protein n=1 Tax=Coptis chinensis TaxID=261450 RepID=A0A835MFH1_9MAGN|nr:hypothetical protein IFM89_028439 [Coptis chinensis]
MMGSDIRIRRDPLAMRMREDQIKEIWGGDPVYPTVNYIQDPNEVIDYRGPDFHEPTPNMAPTYFVAYFKIDPSNLRFLDKTSVERMFGKPIPKDKSFKIKLRTVCLQVLGKDGFDDTFSYGVITIVDGLHFFGCVYGYLDIWAYLWERRRYRWLGNRVWSTACKSVKLLPECAPNSVNYILELLGMRHCAGCQLYRAEGRGSSWDSEGNHIKDAPFGPPFALIQGTLEAEGTTISKSPTKGCPTITRRSVAWVDNEDMEITKKIAKLPTTPDVWNNINVSVLEKPGPLWFHRIKNNNWHSRKHTSSGNLKGSATSKDRQKPKASLTLIDEISSYDWVGTAYTHLIGSLDLVCRFGIGNGSKVVVGMWQVIEYWYYSYFRNGMHVRILEEPNQFPPINNWGPTYRHKVAGEAHCNLSLARQQTSDRRTQYIHRHQDHRLDPVKGYIGIHMSGRHDPKAVVMRADFIAAWFRIGCWINHSGRKNMSIGRITRLSSNITY